MYEIVLGATSADERLSIRFGTLAFA